jgi:EpsI family protein
MAERTRWVPAGMLCVGAVVNAFFITGRVQPVPLDVPLDSLPRVVAGLPGTDVPISDEEQRIAGMTSFVLRQHGVEGAPPAFSVYVGYYDEQRQGKSIHSPRNCLPGAGWEPVGFRAHVIETSLGPITVNRYHLVREDEQSIVYYWYQGRGRIAHDEYRVKYELLRDAALLGRTEEALVRVWVPVRGEDIGAADALATTVSREVVAAAARILPPR